MYNEKKYWTERVQRYGSVNTTKDCPIHPKENYLLLKYLKPSYLVCDYGVGEGRLFPIYNDIKCSVQGLDIADNSKQINEKNKDFQFHYFVMDSDLTELDYPDDNFNVIVSFAVLTHIKPKNIEKTVKEIMRISQTAIISAYDDKPLAVTDDSYCYLHDYKKLFKDYNIIESHKVGLMKFWVIIK